MAVAYFDTEKLNLLLRVAIQPFHGRAVLLGKALGNPDDRHRLQTCRIGEELPQMAMVRPLQLVLNEHPLSVDRVLAEQVGAKRPHVLFRRLHLQLQLQVYGITEQFHVFIPGQPRRELGGFVRSAVTQSTFSRRLNLGISMSESNRWRK